MESAQTGSEITGNVDAGLIAYRKPLRTWAGRGTGATCHGCGRSIRAHEIEYEIELPVRSGEPPVTFKLGSDARTLRFHFECYRNWTGR